MRLRIWTRVRILKLILGCTDTLFLAKYWCLTRVGYDTGTTRRTPVSEWCLFFFFFFPLLRHGKEVSDRYKQEEKRKRKGRRRWEKWVCDLLTWCEICAPNLFFFFPSKPFSNLDPIPLHRSCRYIFFILLLLLFSCVFGFFIANAL